MCSSMSSPVALSTGSGSTLSCPEFRSRLHRSPADVALPLGPSVSPVRMQPREQQLKERGASRVSLRGSVLGAGPGSGLSLSLPSHRGLPPSTRWKMATTSPFPFFPVCVGGDPGGGDCSSLLRESWTVHRSPLLYPIGHNRSHDHD